MDAQEPTLDQTLLTLRVIIGALAAGVVAFGAVSIFIVTTGPRGDNSLAPILLGTLAAIALGLATAYPLLARVKMAQLQRRHGADSFEGGPSGEIAPAILREYAVLTILRGAFIEGPTLFALVIYFVTASPWALAAAALGLFLLLSMIPTRERLLAFVGRVRGRPVIR